mmetsp:Transcript_88329/g.250343  ORF Transcript_88329/g.250343 Transcript_88329/m.250343 type:complete len:227 (-) Transcript_88329:221-901(-)
MALSNWMSRIAPSTCRSISARRSSFPSLSCASTAAYSACSSPSSFCASRTPSPACCSRSSLQSSSPASLPARPSRTGPAPGTGPCDGAPSKACCGGTSPCAGPPCCTTVVATFAASSSDCLRGCPSAFQRAWAQEWKEPVPLITPSVLETVELFELAGPPETLSAPEAVELLELAPWDSWMHGPCPTRLAFSLASPRSPLMLAKHASQTLACFRAPRSAAILRNGL